MIGERIVSNCRWSKVPIPDGCVFDDNHTHDLSMNWSMIKMEMTFNGSCDLMGVGSSDDWDSSYTGRC